MKKAKISTRQKEILIKLCSENDYITIASIAQDIGVSSRTILRELEEIEKWLSEKNIQLEKKTGVGIKLGNSLEEKEELLEIIEKENSIKIFTPKERQIIIASELLQNNEPIKLYYLTKILFVSEGTISNDLDKVEEWLKIYNLNLVRKPGLGIYIEGIEKHKRRAIVNLIYENVEEKQLLNFVQSNITKSTDQAGTIEIKTRNRLLNLIDQDTIRKLEELIYKAEKTMGYKLADSAYVGLIVHLALAIKRIKNNEKISMDKEFLRELKKNSEFLIAKGIAKNISEFFNIEIKEDEIGYITMHLMGSKTRSLSGSIESISISAFELVKIAREMIKVAEAETGCFLGNNEKLLSGLVNHLNPTIKRIKMNMDIRNPLLEEIKSQYPYLIKVSKKCTKVLEDYLGRSLPESEVGYIAMHLGAAIEKREIVPKRKFRVAVACPSGIGTSRLLATKIEMEYDYLQVVDIISTIHVEENWLAEEEIDFIISTIDIEKSSLPTITVNPLLYSEDKNKIDNLIKALNKSPEKPKDIKKNNISLKDKLLSMHSYSEGIIQILDNFFIEETKTRDIAELIDFASLRLMESIENKNQLKKDLISREEKGGTLISGKNLILLHCRSVAVNELYFGALNLKKPIEAINNKGEKEKVDLALIMLAPEESSQGHIEVMSEISKLIIDKPDFLSLLRKGLKEESYIQISSCLNEFYQTKSN